MFVQWGQCRFGGGRNLLGGWGGGDLSDGKMNKFSANEGLLLSRENPVTWNSLIRKLLADDQKQS